MLIGSPTSRASARPTERGRSATCARRDLNPHTRGHQNLNLARLPIPPLARVPHCRRSAVDGEGEGQHRPSPGRPQRPGGHGQRPP